MPLNLKAANYTPEEIYNVVKKIHSRGLISTDGNLADESFLLVSGFALLAHRLVQF